MELAGPALTQEVADLTAGPLRVVLGQQHERFVKVGRGAVVTGGAATLSDPARRGASPRGTLRGA
eukprot:9795401-Alexandrium_andersonii.AAC.1